MYRCEICGNITPPKTPRQTIVKLIPASYPLRRGVIRKKIFEKGKWITKKFDDPGGEGTQTACETICCPKCKEANKLVEIK